MIVKGSVRIEGYLFRLSGLSGVDPVAFEDVRVLMKRRHCFLLSRQKIQSHLFGSLELLFGNFGCQQLAGLNVSDQIDLALTTFPYLLHQLEVLVEHHHGALNWDIGGRHLINYYRER